MEFHIFEDDMTLASIPSVTPRVSVRAIIIEDDTIVLIHNQAIDTYVLPGGGVLQSETLEDAIVREVLEETGLRVKQADKTLCVKEHFHDSIWHHHFYSVTVGKETEPLTLTEEEISLGHHVVYLPLSTALDLLSNHKGKHPYSKNIHQRELIGLLHSL